MKLIALQTIHGRKVVKEADKDDPKSKPKYDDVVIQPGREDSEFETGDLGISDAEAEALVKSGAARRKTREVPDDRPAQTKAQPQVQK